MIEPNKIIADTLRVFNRSQEQKNKFSAIEKYVGEVAYKKLHRDFLTPLDIKIDCDLFKKEIKKYHEWFEPWGISNRHTSRFGLALVNQDGVFKKDDPINGSLYEWNDRNPKDPIFESDCDVPTEAMGMRSLFPLGIFDGTWFRSNILRWREGAEFLPHIDTVIPSPWLRLWAVTDDISLKYWNDRERQVTDIEKGRIYLIDTSLVHAAKSFVDDSYQLFLSVSPKAIDKISELIMNHK